MSDTVLAIVVLTGGILVQLGLGLIPAVIARRKGRSFAGYWLFGFLFFIPALVVSLLVPPVPKSRQVPGGIADRLPCLFCSESVSPNSTVCPYCHQDRPSPEWVAPDVANVLASADDDELRTFASRDRAMRMSSFGQMYESAWKQAWEIALDNGATDGFGPAWRAVMDRSAYIPQAATLVAHTALALNAAPLLGPQELRLVLGPWQSTFGRVLAAL